MSGAGMLRLMARYHLKVNERLLASVPNAEVAKRPTLVGFGSILATVNHIAAVDDLWLQRVTTGNGNAYDYIYTNDPQKSGKYDDELWAELTSWDWAKTQELLCANGNAVYKYVETLKDEDLMVECEYKDTEGNVKKAQRGPALMHLFNHATDHRGQVHSALATFGIEGAVVDMPAVMGSGLRIQ